MRKNWRFKKIHIKNFEYKKRYICVVLFLSFLFFVAISLIKPTIAGYRSSSKLTPDIQYALYLLKEESLSVNLNIDGVVPSSSSYDSTFAIMNYKDGIRSDVDIEYHISLRTTTNLPLKYELYYFKEGASPEKLVLDEALVQDVDGAWYRDIKISNKYQMRYQVDHKDIYTLKVYFPVGYSTNLDYADLLESIEVNVESNQIIS